MFDTPLDVIRPKMKVWILSDGKKGHENQSRGVAQALGFKAKVITLKKRKFGAVLAWVHPSLRVTNCPVIKPGEVGPDVVISTGNMAAHIAMWIKHNSPHTMLVQMMRPPHPYHMFDVIAAPAHDRMPSHENVITTIGAPNMITPEALADAKKEWAPTFRPYKGKKIAVLIGGSNKRYRFDEAEAEKLVQALKAFAKEVKGSLLVTTSRRTGKAQSAYIRDALKGDDVYFWNGKGKNPYMGLLAVADHVVTTADSISMISEGCSAGKPVYVFGLNDAVQHPRMGKFNRFYAALAREKRIAPLGAPAFKAPKHPLCDTDKVAGFVESVLTKRLCKSA